ncbi:MAG: hypothetical protein JJU28_10970 [Cyclobacteriaceae bacterium]|nr:hypothetical protein [Cyclobacteriaceae bacterium]
MKISLNYLIVYFAVLCLSGVAGQLFAGTLSEKYQSLAVFSPDAKEKMANNAMQVFQEEVFKRTGIQVQRLKRLPRKSIQPIVIMGLERTLQNQYGEALAALPATGPEGFKILHIKEQNTIVIAGYDGRGILYGTGRLLRKMEMKRNQIRFPEDIQMATQPVYQIRGHQLGYRPKTNAYDAFTPEMFDQYIRDMALFGTNSVEIVPPRTDDAFSSWHMKWTAMEMIGHQSRICDFYDVDVWMWYPNMGKDYDHPDSIAVEMQERHEVFASVSRLDALFIPGGDPGDLEPDVLFRWMGQVAEILHQYHPQAKLWVSPQVFKPTQEWFDVFFEHVNHGYSWLGGVVFGPWVKIPIEELRKKVRHDLPIRRYPDITHSLSCQYPIPEWDLAFAMTLGRECINPRPRDQKIIHNRFAAFANGSLSYSEGTNDDVNKFIWNDLDWNPDADVMETLRDYARLFIGPEYTEGVAQGMVALEKNMDGPALINDNIERTLLQWQTLEKSADAETMKNFRFQMGLIRAYYDAYVQRKLTYETGLEAKTREMLENASAADVSQTIIDAISTLEKAWTAPVAGALKKRCHELAQDLYESTGAQLTVDPHGAAPGRGNFIDNMDIPLNDAAWLIDQLKAAAELSGDTEKLQKIHEILRRTDPGPGGFYDNFGTPASWKRVLSDYSWPEDPGSLASPRVSFGAGLIGKEWVHVVQAIGFEGRATPQAWMNQINTLYEQPLKIRYDQLDPGTDYVVKVTYAGRFRSRMKLFTDDGTMIHDFIQTGHQPTFEFELPRQTTQSGEVTFVWTCGEGERGAQVSEIWLMPKKKDQK